MTRNRYTQAKPLGEQHAPAEATPRRDRQREDAAYAGVIEKLAPNMAVAERARRRAESLGNDPSFRTVAPHDGSTVLSAWAAACLAVGINPDHACAHQKWLEENRRWLVGETSRLAERTFKLHELALHEDTSGVSRTDGKVRLSKFISWASAEGFTTLVAKVVIAQPDELAAAAPQRKITGPDQQEAGVLAVIRKLGHNPLALPRRVNGKRWVKADVRDELERTGGMWAHGSVLDHTWERLRKKKQILEAG